MQFTVWRYSPKARTIIEFIVTVLFATGVHLLVGEIMSIEPGTRSLMQSLLAKEEELVELEDPTSPDAIALEKDIARYYAQIYPHLYFFFSTMMRLTYLSFGVLFFALQHIPEIVYTVVTKRQFDAYGFKNLGDGAIFGFFFTFIIVCYSKNLGGAWKEKPFLGAEKRTYIYCRNFVEGAPWLEIALLIFCTVSLWIRVFYLLRYNEYLGKLSGVVQKLLKDLIIFFMFFLLEVLFFAVVAELAFRRVETYNSTWAAYETLFYATFGQFDFTDF